MVFVAKRRQLSQLSHPSLLPLPKRKHSRHRHRGRDASSNRGDGGARYILSTEQEEEIRDAFLKDRLEGYTMVSPADFILVKGNKGYGL